jgi:DNA polymerase IV
MKACVERRSGEWLVASGERKEVKEVKDMAAKVARPVAFSGIGEAEGGSGGRPVQGDGEAARFGKRALQEGNVKSHVREEEAEGRPEGRPVQEDGEDARLGRRPLQEGAKARVQMEAPAKRGWFGAGWLGLGKGRGAEKLAHIVHVDVDAFFASVEQVLNPKLRGKPVLVGRGVVASASYEAKFRGVKTAMNFRDALRICPQAIVVPGKYEHYADFAERVRRILETYTPAVETAALDDFYLDFAGTERLYPDFEATLRRLQAEILGWTGLSVSVGAARTKVVASIASRLERPRGFRIVAPGSEEPFLAPLPVEKLHGIGHVHAGALAERGVTTIGQLRMIPKPVLVAAFGDVIGEQIWERARGLDGREVMTLATPKSVSRETTIEGGTIDTEFLGGLLEYLSERIGATLREHGKQAHTVGVKLRYVDHYSAHQTVRLAQATNDERALLGASKELFAKLFTRRVAIRHVGVSVTNLDADRRQNELFDVDANRRWYLNREVDRVRGRYGWNSVFYGKGLELREHYATKENGLVLSTPCLSR